MKIKENAIMPCAKCGVQPDICKGNRGYSLECSKCGLYVGVNKFELPGVVIAAWNSLQIIDSLLTQKDTKTEVSKNGK